MKCHSRLCCLAVLLTVILLWGAGCSAVQFYTSSPEDLAQELMGPPGKLKKQVIVAQFYNPSQARDLDLEQWIGDPLEDHLKKHCNKVLVQDSPRIAFLTAEHFGPITGLANNLDLMAQARTAGAGAIVTGSLWKVALEQEKRGIYPFREMEDIVKVSLDLWVYDPLTGAKLADSRISVEKVLKKGESMETANWKEALFKETVDQMGSRVCKALKDQPWTGFVSSVEGDTLTIASGAEIGLKPGMLLWVCSEGEVMKGVDNEQFVAPGKRLARAKITSVSQTQCQAQLVEEADISTASWVTLRNRSDRINPL